MGLFAHGDLAVQAIRALVPMVIFLGLIGFFVWMAHRANQRQKKHEQYYHDNVERHRIHAERSEEHMVNVELLLERIAAALEEHSSRKA